jgi:hypothetical protein
MSEMHEATAVSSPIPHFERLLDSREAAAFTIFRFGDRHLPQTHDIWLTVAIKNHCAYVTPPVPRELGQIEHQPKLTLFRD